MGLEVGQLTFATRERIAAWWQEVHETERQAVSLGFSTFRQAFQDKALALHRAGLFPDPRPARDAQTRRAEIAAELELDVWRVLASTGVWRNLKTHHDSDRERDRAEAALRRRLEDAEATARFSEAPQALETVRRLTAMLSEQQREKATLAAELEHLSEAIYGAVLAIEEKLGLTSDLTNMTERLAHHATTLGRPTPVDDAVAFADYAGAFDVLMRLTESDTCAGAWNLGLRTHRVVHPSDTRRESRRQEDQVMGVRASSGLLQGGSMNQAGGRRR